jgi:UDP-2,3-diacylglucosamine pyrophosphatase LpxH
MKLKTTGFPSKLLKELSETHEHSFKTKYPTYQRDYLRRIKAEYAEKQKPARETVFKDFLSKGRTLRELTDKFGDNTQELLHAKYEGFSLFEQVDEFSRTLYILLPVTDLAQVKVKPKLWSFVIGKQPDGEIDPYICVQLPAFEGKIQIALLYDLHYGHAKHRRDKLQSYVDWIQRSPNVYAILGGDLMENAIDRGMTFDQDVQPHSQLDELAMILAPIAHKCLFSVPGNHEERTKKATGIDVAKVLADKLEVPYFTGPVFCSILANGHKWTVFAQHGRGNSQTKGGKMNMASRPASFVNNVDFIVCGHVHDRVSEAQTIIVEDPVNCRLIYKNQWVVIAPSFLGWMDTYAYRAGYRPPSLGGVAIYLYADGTSKADQT